MFELPTIEGYATFRQNLHSAHKMEKNKSTVIMINHD